MNLTSGKQTHRDSLVYAIRSLNEWFEGFEKRDLSIIDAYIKYGSVDAMIENGYEIPAIHNAHWRNKGENLVKYGKAKAYRKAITEALKKVKKKDEFYAKCDSFIKMFIKSECIKESPKDLEKYASHIDKMLDHNRRVVKSVYLREFSKSEVITNPYDWVCKILSMILRRFRNGNFWD